MTPYIVRPQPMISIKILLSTIALISSLAAISMLTAMPAHAQPREGTIELKAGMIIEITYASVEGGKESQLMTEYLPKILPIVSNYGAKMLGVFPVSAVTGGEVTPQMVAMFEWPSLEAREKLHADKEAQKLFPIRDDAMTYFKQAFYTVDQDTVLTFKEDKVYEFFNAWTTFASSVSLPAYFKMSDAPKQKYGPPKFIATLNPIKNAPNESYVLNPDMAGIVEWNSTGAYYGLIADPGFKLAAPLLAASVSRLDMIHTKFSFPQ